MTPDLGRGRAVQVPGLTPQTKLALRLQAVTLASSIFHVRDLVPGSPSSVSLGKVSLIYFRLDLHALHKDYHRADSNCASFFCLICFGFTTPALQPILALLGLWACQTKERSVCQSFCRGYLPPLPHPAPPRRSLPSGTGKTPPPCG